MTLFPFPGRPSPRGRRRASRWSGLPLLAALLSACAGAAPAPPGTGPVLRGGLVLEREIRGGERHSYPVHLEKGKFLRIVVDQNGVDVVVRLLDPEGSPVLSVDSLTWKTGEEDCAALAERTGLYRVEVTAASPAEAGRYGLRVKGPRSPSERDRLRVKAVRAMEEAFAAEGKETPEQRLLRYEKALALWHRLGERRREAEMLFKVAETLRSLGRVGRAAEVFSQAAGVWGELGNREMGDLRLQVEALNEAGVLHEQIAQWREAQARYEKALAVAVEAESLRQQAAMLYNLGRFARQRGEARVGIGFLRRSIALARQTGDRELEAKALNSLGSAFMDLSDRQQALNAYDEALAICREIDGQETGSVLNNLGDAYASLGEWEKAREYSEQSLELHRKLGEKTKEATALNNIAVAHLRLGKTDKTFEYLGQALAIAKEINHTGLETSFLTNQSFVYLLKGEAERARDVAQQALELLGDRAVIEAETRFALGSAYRSLGNYEAARAELTRAHDLNRDRGEKSREAEVILELARLEKDRGDLAGALSWVQKSVEIIESLRSRVVSQDLRAAFLASKQAHYELSIDILMALHAAEPGEGHAAEALRVSEQARARSLLEILQEEGADLRLQESSSRYQSLTRPRLLHVEEIQTQILAGGALFLEYALGTERSYLWAVTPDSVESFNLPARDLIEEAARRYYDLLTARNQPGPGEESLEQTRGRFKRLDAEAETAAAELSGMILGPVRHLLKDQPLLVVADGALQYIPFAALPLPGTTSRLIQNHEVVHLPSASVLAELRSEARDRPAASRTLAVLADPVFQKEDERLAQALGHTRDAIARSATHRDGTEREGETGPASFLRLRFSRDEALAIASLLPPDQTFTALGLDASRATAVSGRLADYRNVHFATHGVIDSNHPERSGLVLSLFNERGEPVDGFLRLADIYGLELRADLVVLSACRTALGKEIRGEGLVGLTRGFMYAGTSRVLATLWSVDDRATADFMKHFYRAMLNHKLSPAAALREAQIAMMAKSNSRAPYFWAGFSLQGEWK
jgi:CHAT domain-containing protein/tetratricopeptide (TPR) repeat protein